MVDLTQLEKVKTDKEVEADQSRQSAIAYLSSTDWYVVRQFETGEKVPDEISELRAEARKKL